MHPPAVYHNLHDCYVLQSWDRQLFIERLMTVLLIIVSVSHEHSWTACFG